MTILGVRETVKTGASGKAGSDWRKRMRHPVVFYLVWLILLAVVPAFIFAAVVLNRANEAQERVRESLLRTSTGAVGRVMEREVTTMLSTLSFFTASEQLARGDMRGLQEQAEKALAGTNSYLLVIDRNYHQRLNTRVPYGTPLGEMSDRTTADKAFASGEPAVSNLFFGQTAQKWVFNVHMPETLSTGEQVLLTLTKNAENFTSVVNRDILSPGWNAAVVDDAGVVIVSTDGPDAVGKPFFLPLVPALRIGLASIRHDNTDYQVVTDFSALTGWRIVAWAKASDVQRPATASFLWLAAGGAVFAGLAAGAAILIARALSRDVKLLASDATRLGMGEAVPPRRHVISELDTVSRALSEAADARARAENEVRFLMREVAHRSKNQLTVIQAMLNQSAGTAESATVFADAFRKRVAGLARSTDLMIAHAAQGVELAELARNQLKPFAPDDAARVHIDGPSIRLDSQTAQTFGMALHELATNASKYGAFANDRGRVDLTWSIDDDRLALVWRERGADIEKPADGPQRKGFGSIVLERMLGMALQAELERQMHADGIEWRVRIPLSQLRTDLSDQDDPGGEG
ncbi:sensor histidine kinase [Rhizobium sp. GN54]|uniref:sensor histidine kinase n=1 Tax=Rhizobium sp. GN54 TaxID=2898150 RepID=UPI001E403EB4|nr:sensor histidine kinase [Rhizobium sp. GN54]MCD2184009.1 sensor histidine kinase [Rhizobium sp. GN54]